MKLEFSRQSFEKFSNIKFNENMSGGNRVVSYGRTNMKKLNVAFRNFANTTKNLYVSLKFANCSFKIISDINI
jgi:hypothetical protein